MHKHYLNMQICDKETGIRKMCLTSSTVQQLLLYKNSYSIMKYLDVFIIFGGWEVFLREGVLMSGYLPMISTSGFKQYFLGRRVPLQCFEKEIIVSKPC